MRAVLCSIALAACSGGGAPGQPDAAGQPDAGQPDTPGPDATGQPDAHVPDAHVPDAHVPDAYVPDAYVPDAYVPDAHVPDAYVPDAYVPDAYVPDAYVPDAYVPDAHVPDAYVPDAPVPDFTVSAIAETPDVPGVAAGSPVSIARRVTNNTLSDLVIDWYATGGFIGDGSITLLSGGSVEVDVRADSSSPGDRTGTLAIVEKQTGDSVSIPIAQRVLGGVSASAHGPGRVDVSTPPSTTCYLPCYEPGTAITFTATPYPGDSVSSWSVPACGTATTCTVAAGFPQTIVTVSFVALPVTFDLDITGLGEVALRDDTMSTIVARCDASCSFAIDASHEFSIAASSPGFVDTIDGTPWYPATGGAERDLPLGATSTSVVFGADPHESFLPGTDAAYGPSNQLAIGDAGTITVRDASLAPLWSVPGTHPLYDLAGDLFVQDGAFTKKYDAAGALVASRFIVFENVTPSGGILMTNGSAISVYDAALAPLFSFPLPYDYDGCVGQSSTGFVVAVNPDYEEFAYFSPTGALLQENLHSFTQCSATPDWLGDIVVSWGGDNAALSPEAYDSDAFVQDYHLGSRSYAADDAIGHLYWVYDLYGGERVPGFQLHEVGYASAQRGPWEFGSGLFPDVGVTARSLSVSPDGHQAMHVTWSRTDDAERELIDIRAPM